MNVRAARFAWARGWAAAGRPGAPVPPPAPVDVATLLREATVEEPRVRRAPGQCSVLLFPGQGSQVVGMGRGLLGYPRVRELYDAARRVLGYDLLELSLHGPQEDLDRTVHCQPAVFVASLAAVEKLQQQQPAVRWGEVGEATGLRDVVGTAALQVPVDGVRGGAARAAPPRSRALRGGRPGHLGLTFCTCCRR